MATVESPQPLWYFLCREHKAYPNKACSKYRKDLSYQCSCQCPCCAAPSMRALRDSCAGHAPRRKSEDSVPGAGWLRGFQRRLQTSSPRTWPRQRKLNGKGDWFSPPFTGPSDRARCRGTCGCTVRYCCMGTESFPVGYGELPGKCVESLDNTILGNPWPSYAWKDAQSAMHLHPPGG